MVEEKRTLQLTFGTESGEEVNLTINSPNGELEDTTVNRAMDAIISSGAFGDKEQVTMKAAAKYVVKGYEQIDIRY